VPLYVSDKEAKELQEILVAEGECSTLDEAAHFLIDCGEINSTQHAEMLTPKERKRVYGD
jgi:hypothetical protein